MKKQITIFILILIFINFFACSMDLSNILKKVESLKIENYRIKGIITKIFFLDSDLIYLYEIKSTKTEQDFALMVSDKKYRRGDKPEIVTQAFRLFANDFEQKKEDYWSILKNYILKKTLLSNTEVILLIKKIDTIITQYLAKMQSIVIILESYQKVDQE